MINELLFTIKKPIKFRNLIRRRILREEYFLNSSCGYMSSFSDPNVSYSYADVNDEELKIFQKEFIKEYEIKEKNGYKLICCHYKYEVIKSKKKNRND